MIIINCRRIYIFLIVDIAVKIAYLDIILDLMVLPHSILKGILCLF